MARSGAQDCRYHSCPYTSLATAKTCAATFLPTVPEATHSTEKANKIKPRCLAPWAGRRAKSGEGVQYNRNQNRQDRSPIRQVGSSSWNSTGKPTRRKRSTQANCLQRWWYEKLPIAGEFFIK